MRLLNKLWADTHASVAPMSMLLLMTIVTIGGVVGLSTLRDQIVQEFVDVGVALNSLDHSVYYDIEVDTDGDGTPDYELTADYTDICGELCGNDPLTDPFDDQPGLPPGDLDFTAP